MTELSEAIPKGPFPRNSIAGRTHALSKKIGTVYMRHFDWITAIELAHEERTGQRLKPDDVFSEADERMAKKIMQSREPDNVA